MGPFLLFFIVEPHQPIQPASLAMSHSSAFSFIAGAASVAALWAASRFMIKDAGHKKASKKQPSEGADPRAAQVHALRTRIRELEHQLAAVGPAAAGSPTSSSAAAALSYPIATPVASIPSSHLHAALFDLDGTLVESKEIWYALLTSLSEHLGYGPLPREKWEPTFGQSMQQNRDLFYPNHPQSVVDAWCETHYGSYVDSHLHVLPGARDALAAVAARVGRDRMSICTNCPASITRQILLNCPMLNEFFSAQRTICAGSTVQLTAASIAADSTGCLARLQLSEDEFTQLSEGCTVQYTLKPKPSSDIVYWACSHGVLSALPSASMFVGDAKFDLMAAIPTGAFAVGIGEKGAGGHMHLQQIGELADKIQAAPKH